MFFGDGEGVDVDPPHWRKVYESTIKRRCVRSFTRVGILALGFNQTNSRTTKIKDRS